MTEILSVGSTPARDGTIIKKEYHSYTPYTTTFDRNDEVRIAIQSQDLYILPAESYIYIELTVSASNSTVHAATPAGTWSANHAAYLFSEIRYELNNIEIDRVKNPGLTSNMKAFTAYPSSQKRIVDQITYYTGKTMESGTLTFLIPLNQVFGFCDDYRKIIMNAKHELIMVLNRKYIYSYTAATEKYNITVTKIQWKMPHIQLADQAKLQMLKYLERKQTISVPYRSWDLYEMPQLPQSDRHIWTVKSTTQMSKPRYVLVTFQTNRLTVSSNSTAFDHCNISDVKLFLNSDYYPYLNYDSDFNRGNYQNIFYNYLKIQNSYYNGLEGENPYQYKYDEFGESPIFAFDCSRTDESLMGGTVDIRLEIKARANISANTVANCLIIYDNYFDYSPFSGIVVRST